MEVIFLLAFTLHNLEEGIWLPRWSQHAGKYYSPVSEHEFHFALIVITSVGYFITFLFLLYGENIEAFKYIFLGFVLMMSMNSIFPHLLATIALKRYAPGTLTGVLLNLPIGMAILINSLETGMQLHLIIISGISIAVFSIVTLRPLFKLGNKLIDEY